MPGKADSIRGAAEVRNTADYRADSLERALELLGSTVGGLSEADAQRRLTTFGLNQVSGKEPSPVRAFLQHYWGPMPWLLEAAIALAIVLQHFLEAGLIFGLLTTNAIIGQIQSAGSHKAMEALKKRLAIRVRVLRDGKWTVIDAAQIVPGDIISIGLGDIVPADAKLLDGAVSVDQSIITGESEQVEAETSDVIYSGSLIKRGHARCVVVTTGTHTYFGATAELVKRAAPKSHQAEIMLAIVKNMMILGAVALAAVVAYATAIGAGVLSILTLAVVFLMGAVPVALPAVMTIVESVGATELSRKGVLVTRLDSIEDAASVDILCLDKTGTITYNRLRVDDVVPFGEQTRAHVTEIATLASREEGQDAIDLAVLEYARTAGVDVSSYTAISFTPFEPATKRTEAIVASNGKRVKAIKGAPQTVLALCKGLDDTARASVEQSIQALSLRGYRTLGVAESALDGADDVRFVGLVSLADPVRAESKAMIESARQLGVKSMMLTGDNIAIAKEIARQVSIGDRIIRMEDFRALDDTEQTAAIRDSDGFAEIFPEDKYKIVRLLQSMGHTVGMTGDGVNDAPALKQAEMGVAVSSATDVAKASASMVLTEEGIGVIIDAIRTSRHIYQRMLTWVINKVTKVVQVTGVLTIGFFWFHDAVVSLLGMALLIVANDFVTMSLATDNVGYTANPDTWDVRRITLASLIIGGLLVIAAAVVLLAGSRYFHLPWDRLQTFVVLMLIYSSQFRVFIVRERRYFWSSRPGRSLMVATAGAVIIASVVAAYGIGVPPLSARQILFLLAFSAVSTLGVDMPKRWAFRRFSV